MKRLRLSGLLLLILCLSLLAIPFWNDRIVRRYIDKIWLHRTNSIEKLHEFEQEYKNFECDVLFLTDSATFEIGHDEPSGEPLKPYLDFLGTNPDRELWLDLKNLNESNCIQAETTLTGLLAQRDVDKDQLIIESRDWKALHHFTQEGYYTSCYLDIPHIDELSDAERLHRLDSIQQIAHSGAVSALSFPASYYAFLRNLDFSVDLLTWEHRRWAWQLPFFSRSRAILKDGRVKSRFGERKGTLSQMNLFIKTGQTQSIYPRNNDTKHEIQ